MSIRIITTADGSNSLLNEEVGEAYHSIHGALQESRHVFIRNGVAHWYASAKTSEVRVLEIGFGTGLNALLTMEYVAGSPRQVHYLSLEAYPVAGPTVAQLNYASRVDWADAAIFFEQLHACSWLRETSLNQNFTLSKHKVKLQDADLATQSADVVYFDAFSPEKQPELWECAALAKVVEAMRPGAVFVTYCAKGQFKRDLKSCGLTVEALPGPPGKREMVRATKH